MGKGAFVGGERGFGRGVFWGMFLSLFLFSLSLSFSPFLCLPFNHAPFKLSPSALHQLTATTSTIIHCGAMVNWALPLSSHSPSNIFGTSTLLALALYINKTKKERKEKKERKGGEKEGEGEGEVLFCHISTLGLLCGGVLGEVCPTPTTGLSLKGGYAQVYCK